MLRLVLHTVIDRL